MDYPPLPNYSTSQGIISSSFDIKQGNINYSLNINSNEQNLTLKISEENIFTEEYERQLNISDINGMNKNFKDFISFKEFVNYLKAQIENNNVEISKTPDCKILIRLKEEKIEIILKKNQLGNNLIIRNLCQEIVKSKNDLKKLEISYEKVFINDRKLNQEIEDLKNLNNELLKENKNIKDDIIKLSEENKKIKEENQNLGLNIEKYKNLDKNIENILEQIKTINQNMNEIIEENEELKEENQNNKNKIIQLEKTINEIKDKKIGKLKDSNLESLLAELQIFQMNLSFLMIMILIRLY